MKSENNNIEIEKHKERRDLLFQAIEKTLDEIINERIKNSNWEKLNNDPIINEEKLLKKKFLGRVFKTFYLKNYI